MKDVTMSSPGKCPSTAELSEWVDNEGEGNDLGAHLGQCVECSRIVASYEQLDLAARDVISPPADLTVRIKARCRTAAAEPLVFPIWRQRLWRYAAAVAVVASALMFSTVLWRQQKVQNQGTIADPGVTGSQDPQLYIAAADEDEVVTSEIEVAQTPSTTTPRRVAASAALTAGLAIPVGLRVGGGTSLQSYYDWNNGRPSLVVPNHVQHVWVTANIDFAQKVFFQNLPPNSLYVDGIRRDDGGNYTVALSDKHLQELVDKLAQSDLILLSPTVPQPGYGDKLITTGKVVRYDANFVQR